MPNSRFFFPSLNQTRSLSSLPVFLDEEDYAPCRSFLFFPHFVLFCLLSLSLSYLYVGPGQDFGCGLDFDVACCLVLFWDTEEEALLSLIVDGDIIGGLQRLLDCPSVPPGLIMPRYNNDEKCQKLKNSS